MFPTQPFKSKIIYELIVTLCKFKKCINFKTVSENKT